MGLKLFRVRWLVVAVLLLVPLLVVGCNRAAPQPEEEQLEQETTLETTEQVMPTGEETAAETETTAPAAVETAPEEPAAEESTTEVEATPVVQQAEPVEEAPPAEEEPVVEAPTSEQTYIVMPEDTLFSIALTYGVSVEEIALRNGIQNVNAIEVGQQIIIPVPGSVAPDAVTPAGEQVHIVATGENLFRIALAYELSFETLATYNSIPWPYTIYVGQVIKIPPIP